MNGKSRIRAQLYSCVICKKINAKATKPLFGQLPASRISPLFAFDHTGEDFAGPFSIRKMGPRVRTVYKAYVCLFGCLQTKVVHLERSIDLSTEAFLDVLHRFVSRRARPSVMYSDNGSNFVGSWNELQRLFKSNALHSPFCYRGIYVEI